MYQFCFLQFIILMGAMSKVSSKTKAEVPRHKRLKGKAILFIMEGVLLLIIAWIWKNEPELGPVYYLVGGITWLLAGIITFWYVARQYENPVRGHGTGDI